MSYQNAVGSKPVQPTLDEKVTSAIIGMNHAELQEVMNLSAKLQTIHNVTEGVLQRSNEYDSRSMATFLTGVLTDFTKLGEIDPAVEIKVQLLARYFEAMNMYSAEIASNTTRGQVRLNPMTGALENGVVLGNTGSIVVLAGVYQNELTKRTYSTSTMSFDLDDSKPNTDLLIMGAQIGLPGLFFSRTLTATSVINYSYRLHQLTKAWVLVRRSDHFLALEVNTNTLMTDLDNQKSTTEEVQAALYYSIGPKTYSLISGGEMGLEYPLHSEIQDIQKFITQIHSGKTVAGVVFDRATIGLNGGYYDQTTRKNVHGTIKPDGTIVNSVEHETQAPSGGDSSYALEV